MENCYWRRGNLEFVRILRRLSVCRKVWSILFLDIYFQWKFLQNKVFMKRILSVRFCVLGKSGVFYNVYFIEKGKIFDVYFIGGKKKGENFIEKIFIT